MSSKAGWAAVALWMGFLFASGPKKPTSGAKPAPVMLGWQVFVRRSDVGLAVYDLEEAGGTVEGAIENPLDPEGAILFWRPSRIFGRSEIRSIGRRWKPQKLEYWSGERIASEPVRDPVDVVKEEIEKWRGETEESPKGREMVERYWREGVGRFPGHDEPWSGAFMAWAINRAIPGALLRAGMHSAYARHGLKAGPGEYATLKPSTPIRRGDIIVKPRQGEKRSFSELLKPKDFPSHGDLILSVGGGFADAAGGNKRNTVTFDRVKLNPDGTFPGAFAVMRLPQAIS